MRWVFGVALGVGLAGVACSDEGGAPVGPGADDGGGGDAGVESGGDAGPPQVIVPRTGISASELGVLVNDDDPLSVQVAQYYVTKRAIPAKNVVHLKLPTGVDAIDATTFAPLKSQVDGALGADVQAMAITWTRPYRVGNMAITSAFALGYAAIGSDTCNDPLAKGGTPNPYVKDRASTKPFTDLKFRPAMVIPATKIEEATALIDRGAASDDTWPKGTAYLMSTSDHIRSARCVLDASYGYVNECQKFLDGWDTTGSGVAASIVAADSIENQKDVLFYVQGLASVPKIATNTYLPGAIADHLTSFGGQIPTSGQMSCFQWILAGATGTFGTVVEPCAYQEKFPDPRQEIPWYFGGATLIEAYWKSVTWPAEGIFVGEPLARPFGTGFHPKYQNGTLTIETTAMKPGRTYVVEAADVEAGPYEVVQADLKVTKSTRSTITIPNATRRVYRFRE